ncbi:hypothetical protein C5688_14155 [Methylocystis sp. MitZ-2018]|nr:hypothetical protein C5688_14155 [Methylocystis sp. MitZ-2018]
MALAESQERRAASELAVGLGLRRQTGDPATKPWLERSIQRRSANGRTEYKMRSPTWDGADLATMAMPANEVG